MQAVLPVINVHIILMARADQSGDFPASIIIIHFLYLSFVKSKAKKKNNPNACMWITGHRLLTSRPYWGSKMRMSKQKNQCYLTCKKLGLKPKRVQISSKLYYCFSVELFNGIDMFPWKIQLHCISIFWDEHYFVSGPLLNFLPPQAPWSFHSTEMNVAQEMLTRSALRSRIESLYSDPALDAEWITADFFLSLRETSVGLKKI